MTLSDLFATAWRHRVVVVLGLVVTLAAGLLAIQYRTVYWTRTEVVFLVPRNEFHPNALSSSESIVITAGAVAKVVLGPGRVPKYASPEATLVGAGVREGWSIGLPDNGGQWATNFDSQVLSIEAVGPSQTFVLDKVRELRERIATSLDDLQEAEGVSQRNRITVKASPQVPTVYGVTGSRPRALVMTGLLGAGLTLAAVLTLEARRSSRRVEPLPQRRELAAAGR
ncbi:hypothetical protein [Nocardioides pinisoli]|uniref:Polysaccharide chain length determinant N-terminal domain-containing protein n=1 Tax=Nocardioides pinisoli TaxID=2950279 RepID=A0ABT1KZ54_9ACTN|nr:hypothetical protein [Nocardioides pinisoli]MCP3423037.1 hypothetical protein [Nocardioides pinisoli]